MKVSYLIAILSTSILANCANLNTVNKRFNPGAGDSRLIDAKQRAIISVIKEDGVHVCAEPSPDALAATAAALGGSGQTGEQFVQAALSSSEGAASIGLRTQSIQLLRDAFYRICEAHLNGGLDDVSFDILQRRYQNQMIAFLAVEQLTGATVAAQANISSIAKSDVEASSQNLQKQITDSRAELNVLMGERQSANEEKAELGVAIANAEEGAAKEGLKKNEEALGEQIAQLTKAIDTENARLSALTTASAAVEKDKSNTSAGALASIATGGGQQSAEIKAVANTVERITLAAMNQEYPITTCIETLRRRFEGGGSIYFSFCERLLQAVANGQGDLIADQIHTNRAKAHALENLARALARSGSAEAIGQSIEEGLRTGPNDSGLNR